MNEWLGPEDFGRRLRAELQGQSVPGNGRPVEHLRQIYEYHKHSDWMFLQRTTVTVTLNLGLFALYAGLRGEYWPVGGLVVLVGFLTTYHMQRWTQRLDERMVELTVYLEQDPVYLAYVKAVEPTPPNDLEERRRAWKRKRLHYTAVYALYAAWILAGLVSVIALIAWTQRAWPSLQKAIHS